MATHEPRMAALGWIPYLGQTDSLVSKRILGRYPVKIQEVAEDALDAFEQALIATGYENPCDWTGSYMKRLIAGTDMWSTHAYGTAIDLDYGGGVDEPFIDRNPHIHRPIQPSDFGVECQLLEHQVRAVEAIKNLDGRSMWRWLGWSIGDTMHFQLDVSPNMCQVDWSTVAGYEQGDEGLTITELVTDETWQVLWDTGHIDGNPDVMPDYYFAAGIASDAEKLNGYNVAIQSLARSQPASQALIDQVNLIEASLDDTQVKLRSV